MIDPPGVKNLSSEENLEKLENPLGKRLGVSERGLGGEKIEVSRERSREMRFGSHEEVYIEPQ